MLAPLFAGITAFLISFAFLPFIIRFSREKKIFAVPGPRRIHKKTTPSFGGVAIFFGFTIACLCWNNDSGPTIFRLLPILIIPFIIGFLDDLIHLTPVAKLVAQFITASLVFFILDIRLESFYGLMGDGPLPSLVSYAITLLAVVIITNSLNLIDGIDGLAAVFSFMATLFFGTWFFFCGLYDFAIICFSLCGGMLSFLFQNWEPSKIFMGDTGSLVIGTVLSILMIKFINTNHALHPEHQLKFQSSVGSAVAIMIIPLMDTTRIIIIRLYKRIPLFTADKRHIHHALVDLNLSHRQAVYILALVHFIFFMLVIFLRDAPEKYMIGAIITLAAALCIILEIVLRKVEHSGNSKKDEKIPI